MSVKFLGVHEVRVGETVSSLAKRFRLSSSMAITDAPANKKIDPPLASNEELPEGAIVAIPPNAADLTKERLWGLHAARPAFLDHFDQLQSLAKSGLQPAMFATKRPLESESVRAAVAELEVFVADGVGRIAGGMESLLTICQGMAHTHVAQWTDHAAVEALADPHCSLYWAISPAVFEIWTGMWAADLLEAKWMEKDAESSWRLAAQHQNLVRTLVVQQIDQRIRDAQALERRLQQETGH